MRKVSKPKIHRMSTNSFYPIVKSEFGCGYHEGVIEHGALKLGAHTFNFVDQRINDNTKVLFHMSNWGEAIIKSEYEDYERYLTLENNLKVEKERQLKNNKRDEALRYYENLKFPVTFHLGIKDNLSGLTENSWGNGAKKIQFCM